MKDYLTRERGSVDEYVNGGREVNASPLDEFIVARVINELEIRLKVALS